MSLFHKPNGAYIFRENKYIYSLYFLFYSFSELKLKDWQKYKKKKKHLQLTVDFKIAP
jgi:hypothetical protein